MTVIPIQFPAGFTGSRNPCHPSGGVSVLVGGLALLVVAAGGSLAPVAAAPVDPALSSAAARAALLAAFDGAGSGADLGGDGARFRANRRHPDVGYISLDPICLECVFRSLTPPPSEPIPTTEPAPVHVAAPVAAPEPPLPAAPAVFPLQDVSLLPSGSEASPLFLPQPTTPIALPMATMELPIAAPLVKSMVAENFSQAPAPLPVLGAGAAFAFSRRLRQRIRSVRPR